MHPLSTGPTVNFIVSMFDCIDKAQYANLDRSFHRDVTYRRPGFPLIQGFDDLLDFYQRRRVIARGRHLLERVTADADSAVALGIFQGVLKDGTDVDEPFADAYAVNDGLIIDRRTYFFRKSI